MELAEREGLKADSLKLKVSEVGPRGRLGAFRGYFLSRYPTPGCFVEVCQKKGDAGASVRKCVKNKGDRNWRFWD